MSERFNIHPITTFAASFCCVMLFLITVHLKNIHDELVKLNKALIVEKEAQK